MPEGDTIFRAATVLRQAMAGGVVQSLRLDEPRFDVEAVVGQRVTAVEARGKHLLIHLERGGAIHSHMGMTGSWHVYRPGEPWRKPARNAAVIMAINGFDLVCFSPPLVELLSADQLRRHEHLRSLGPDLLAEDFDAAGAAAELRRRDNLPLGEAVMNQRIVAGIGNVYKSELLFLLAFDPFARGTKYSDAEFSQLAALARDLMRRNLSGAARRTRFRGDLQRLWVYGRRGEDCFKCGTTIQVRRQGEAGRTTYWCPECQPPR